MDDWAELAPINDDEPPAEKKPRRQRKRRGMEVTEDGVAQAFTAQHAGKLRFDHTSRAWYEWAGDHWRRDDTARAFDWCRLIARDHALAAEDKDRSTARRASFARGVETFARADRAHAVTSDTWDADPWLLGSPGVTIDLQTGEAREPDPAEGITRRAAVAPDEYESCPGWIQFLEDATGADGDLMRFLQQWAGINLTGDTREHAMCFIHGDGGNGKTVFVNTLAGILADYAQTADMGTFVASYHDRHPADLAALRGARMVTASETEAGRRWNETRIKALTGGDPISARFMRRDFFTFRPEFKLTITGNNRPALSSVDEAVRRRFCIVPFTRKPPPQKVDPELEAKLRAEWPGILRWAINGCLDWREHGLIRPRAILDATADYLSSQDVVGQWLEAECRLDSHPLTWDTAGELFDAWSAFAQRAGERPGRRRAFGEQLSKRGLRPDRETVQGKTQRIWRGVQLLRDGAAGNEGG